ncbi:Rieske 2Fe-2S domain-containing protein [Pseudooceanicola algae]|uniref:Oxidoreductase NdmD n=1 Tax=Pseudooceanicola algae TaxID=1537215 RepID=A0A418SHQ9_9RHOB|nr:Rieske 2Fe-2S domain-containing protein [Pseudooceanicola algae]QPM90426.1 Oxidoreductase NdmD [Pseudooceanicola algae]
MPITSTPPQDPTIPPEHLAQWLPVASAGDLALRHVFHGQLWGQELALWRADDGTVNVWENRCLHRGVRLSVGLNEGRELRCIYHGWRYANRTAGCTYIPAHPADAPARTICNRTYEAREAHGLIWSAVAPQPGTVWPDLPADLTALRPLPVTAPLDLCREFAADLAEDPTPLSPFCLRFGSRALWLFLQPSDAGKTILRGLIPGPVGRDVLRYWSHRFETLRRRIEAQAAHQPAPAPYAPVYAPVDPELAAMPARSRQGPKTELRARIAEHRQTAEGICALRLEPLEPRIPLPTPQPGAHIDIALPNGLTRQYSLTNGPGETGFYEIGVKLEPASRGGSAAVHGDLRQGDTVALSAPRNNFPLRRDAVQTILLAGGIGITPMLAMAQALAAQGLDYCLHAFARSAAHLPFAERRDRLGDAFQPHLGLDPQAVAAQLEQILAAPGFARHVYVCGPGAMLDAARRIAADRGWPEANVHFEYFSNTKTLDDSSRFEIALARSAMTLQVPAGTSILEVLRANGVDMPSSCEQGACGTCLAGVLDGAPDHQDVYLSQAEKAAGDRIMTCVSRARSGRLVLDL